MTIEDLYKMAVKSDFEHCNLIVLDSDRRFRRLKNIAIINHENDTVICDTANDTT